MKPRIGLLAGDPSGIGPEIAAKLLAEPETLARAEIVAIGDAAPACPLAPASRVAESTLSGLCWHRSAGLLNVLSWCL